jgi:predicted enzyme related to lactoylglutathione lyase
MPNPARAGALIYTKELDRISCFYQQLLGMKLLYKDSVHHVIESEDMQIIVHAIPEHVADMVSIASPPKVHESQAIKLFFTAPSIDAAISTALESGGAILEQEYLGPGFKVRNGYDPEGNIFQVREILL